MRYPDWRGNKRLNRPRAYSFINSWLILYLLVITLVEAGRHLLILLKQRRAQRFQAEKTSKFGLNAKNQVLNRLFVYARHLLLLYLSLLWFERFLSCHHNRKTSCFAFCLVVVVKLSWDVRGIDLVALRCYLVPFFILDLSFPSILSYPFL